MTGSLTELLIGLAIAVAGYLLRHYGVKVPGLPRPSPAPPAGPAAPTRGPILSAVLAALSARLGLPVPVILEQTVPPGPTPVPPTPAPSVQAAATGPPTDSDADIALARDLLTRFTTDDAK